jgi:hypothetical protein
MSDGPRYYLACPFLTDSFEFACGVEVGMLWERMKRRRSVNDYFFTANQEQILLMAKRLGWEVLSMRPWSPDGQHPQWFHLRMRRRGPPHPSALEHPSHNV